MAHGFECTKCGYQETIHKHYRDENPGCCSRYRSPSWRAEKKMWDAEAENNVAVAIKRAGGEL